MSPMPRAGRKASSLLLLGAAFSLALVTVLGGALAQGEKGSPMARVVTVGVVEEGGVCPGGATPPCWDTLTIPVRAGENVSIVADLRTSEGNHNLAIYEGTKALTDDVAYDPPNAKGDGTVPKPNGLHVANFTVPADYAGELTFVCQVHANSMKGKILLAKDAGAAGGGEPVHHLGVHFLAYWVGVIAFALLFIVYGITFFLFKYNETTATTDQWDRTGAGAPEVSGKRMSGGNATLLAIVIAAIVLAGVVYLARMG